MFHRRQFLTHALKGSSLVALNATSRSSSPGPRAAAPGKDTILVVVELTGGNDGVNTVIPYADDLYHKARPTLRQTKNEVIRLDDHVGLHSGMRGSSRSGTKATSRSFRASATRTRTARTSRRWTSGTPPTRAGEHDRLARPGGGGDGEPRAGCRSCTSAPAAAAGRDRPGRRGGQRRRQEYVPPRAGGGKAASRRPAASCSTRSRRPGKAGGRRPSVVRPATAGADADRGRDPARAARRARTRCAAGHRPRPEVSDHRRADREGVRHPRLLRQPRRLRHPRQPGQPRTTTCWASWPTRSASSSRR